MRLLQLAVHSAVAVALAGMVLPPSLLYAQQPSAVRPAAPTLVIVDVALKAGGNLQGQVVNADGAPLADTRVDLLQEGRILISGKTDDQGRFAVQSLRGGVYQIVSAGGVSVVRAWSAETAPPSAGEGVMVVAGQNVVRGKLLSNTTILNPVVIAGVLAALSVGLDTDPGGGGS